MSAVPPEIEEGDGLCPRFGADGLLPAIVQDRRDGTVLMLAWMNAESFEKTLATGQAHYWSRSRKALWRKGETSGHVQTVHEVRIDCDQDAVLLIVTQEGESACHTGRDSCFYRTCTADQNLSFDTGRLSFGVDSRGS